MGSRRVYTICQEILRRLCCRFLGLNVDVYATTEDNEVIELSVPSTHMNGFLIGNHGDTMRSVCSFLTSMALQNAGSGAMNSLGLM
jgi:predicted RNA-binding protein Jag